MDSHPQLEFVKGIVSVLGWPALLGILVWLIRTWDKGQQQIHAIDAKTTITVQSVADVKAQVDVMKDNHLAHLQEGIAQVAASNDKAVEVLHKIDAGIQILVDRHTRT